MNQFVAFLLGAIFIESVAAGLFFIRFWRSTRDILFLAFSVFFLVEALDRFTLLFSDRPNEGSLGMRLFRLAALIFLVAVIAHRNYASRSRNA